MALKRQHDMMAMFSMASMTDVIFLLLIFFMITSTFVFPTALEVNLPQSTVQTALKPGTRVYIDNEESALLPFLQLAAQNASADEAFIAIYADEEVPYGKIVEVLDLGARNNLKMVLATRPTNSRKAAYTGPESSTKL